MNLVFNVYCSCHYTHGVEVFKQLTIIINTQTTVERQLRRLYFCECLSLVIVIITGTNVSRDIPMDDKSASSCTMAEVRAGHHIHFLLLCLFSRGVALEYLSILDDRVGHVSKWLKPSQW